jgi:hypothetical protein
MRDGVLIEEHERDIDETKNMTLAEKIKRKKEDEEKQDILFGKK